MEIARQTQNTHGSATHGVAHMGVQHMGVQQTATRGGMEGSEKRFPTSGVFF